MPGPHDRPSPAAGALKRRPTSPPPGGGRSTSSSSRPPQQPHRPSHGPALAGVAPAATTPLARSKSVSGGGRSGSGTPLLTATGVHSARRVFYGNNQLDGGGSPGLGGATGEPTTYWSVQWRKPQFKKHKTWDGDGILIVRNGKCFLKDENGKDIGTAKMTADIASGDELRVGGKEVEIDSAIPANDYISGNCYATRTATPLSATSAQNRIQATERVPLPAGGWQPPTVLKTPFKPPLPMAPQRSRPAFVPPTPVPQQRARPPPPPSPPAEQRQIYVKPEPESSDVEMVGPDDAQHSEPEAGPSKRRRVAAENETDEEDDGERMPTANEAIRARYGHLAMQAPKAGPSHASSGPRPEASKAKARFDPTKPGAVIMKRPGREHQKENNKKGFEVIDVVLDPKLSDKMRAHQKEGVKFMYNCVMGLGEVEGQGAILADEMGLGKTLQSIALVWTLLKQNPYANPHQQGVVGKVLIACPVTLVTNWSKEFRKWLGRDALGVFIGDGDKSQIRQFANSRRHQVLIIGYEKLRTVMDDLRFCQPPIDLIICDEGHRLKSKDAKTSKMFEQLKTKRRIILSGTPLQNDLGEFWSMVEFVNPGLLHRYPEFVQIYEKPIMKSRTPGCNKTDLELGRGRSAQLNKTSKGFILRRDASVISKFLPPKREYVIFVAPTALQLQIFRELLKPETVQAVVRNSGPGGQSSGGPQPLALIMYARQICNSPMLFKKDDAEVADTASNAIKKARALVPDDRSVNDISCSGKLLALADILSHVKDKTDEKVVVVSNFTKALDVIEALLRLRKYKFERLDGSTPQVKRQEMVDRFNRATQTQSFVFLLSSKSGGAGLNLIGASRLIMLDCDWNPSTDQQAMARIHRDGQKRPVFIYRLLTTGTIDEKIYQRQVTKLGLSSSVMNHQESDSETGGGGGSADAFTKDELRRLFQVESKTACATHDLLGCDCQFETLEDEGPADPINETHLSDGSQESSDEEHAYIGHPTKRPPPRKKSEARKAREKEDKLAVLKEWSHIQCVGVPPPANIQDTVLLSLVRAAAREHDGLGGDDESEAKASGSEHGSSPPRPPPLATIERELSWSPSPPPEAARPVDPFADVIDDGYSTTSSPGAGVTEFLEDDISTSPELALAQLPPVNKGKQREKLFMDGGSEDELDADGSRLADAARPRHERGGRRRATKWQSNVDTYRMANDGEGGRLTFLFERVSLGAEAEAAAGS